MKILPKMFKQQKKHKKLYIDKIFLLIYDIAQKAISLYGFNDLYSTYILKWDVKFPSLLVDYKIINMVFLFFFGHIIIMKR